MARPAFQSPELEEQKWPLLGRWEKLHRHLKWPSRVQGGRREAAALLHCVDDLQAHFWKCVNSCPRLGRMSTCNWKALDGINLCVSSMWSEDLPIVVPLGGEVGLAVKDSSRGFVTYKKTGSSLWAKLPTFFGQVPALGKALSWFWFYLPCSERIDRTLYSSFTVEIFYRLKQC